MTSTAPDKKAAHATKTSAYQSWIIKDDNSEMVGAGKGQGKGQQFILLPHIAD